jgi:CBS domain-containing protein
LIRRPKEDEYVVEAAEVMRRDDIGDVLVMADDDRVLVGILIDRDIVVRALAEDRDPAQTRAPFWWLVTSALQEPSMVSRA